LTFCMIVLVCADCPRDKTKDNNQTNPAII
jgi:hypothetical protein